MSTPSISAPTRIPSDLDTSDPAGLAGRAHTVARRLVRGREADPVWSRPALWLVTVLAGVLTLWGLTRSGYANTYYAEAAQAASRSWTAWLTNALDSSGTESLDKGPLPNMLMGMSGRLLGFSGFSMLLPEALCGMGAVLVLHNTVKRTLGHKAAILAALMLALTPIFVAMSRYNNPDALLVLLEVMAAWALVRALQSGRTREVLLCGVLVGLAFNVKMLQAYLIVPALAATLLIAGQGSVRRRVGQLLAGGLAMLVVSFAWYGTMMLIPAANRPWVGDTTDNSWFSLIFGANGFGRVSGEGGGVGPGGGGGATFGGAAGPGRLLNSIVGGQIAWLLPLAAVGLVLGLWTRRRAPRTDRARSAYVLWGLWAAVSWAVFSFSKGIFHPYYTTALAPAVAVLASGGLVVLWDKARVSMTWTVALGVAVVGTVALGAVLLGRAKGFAPWLAPTAMVFAVIATTGLLLARAKPVGSAAIRSRIAVGAAAVALVALLAGPAAYSISTVGKALDGGNPLAGPASAEAGLGGGPGGAPGSGAGRGGFARAGLPPGASGLRPQGGGIPGRGVPADAPSAGSASSAQGGPPALFGSGSGTSGSGSGAPGAVAGTTDTAGASGSADGFPGAGEFAGPGAGGGQASKALVSYLKTHQGKAAYIVAAVGSSTAGSIALESGREAIDMGGFMGSDPAPSLAKLKSFIASGQLHYVLLSGTGAGALGGAASAQTARGGAATTQSGAGLQGGPGGSTSSAGGAAVQTRDAWVEAHGKVVHVSGASSGGATLYYFA